MNTLYECFGLPGSGKTTVSVTANETLGLPGTADISTYWRLLPIPRKISLLLHSLLTEFNAYMQIIIFILRNRLFSGKSIFYLLKIPAQKVLVKDFLKSKPLLLDQWQLQNLWSAILNAHVKDVTGLPAVIGAIYKGLPVKILYFEAPHDIAAARIASREHGRSRFDTMPHHEIGGALEKTSFFLHKIADCLPALGLAVETMDGRQDLEMAAQNLQKACAGG